MIYRLLKGRHVAVNIVKLTLFLCIGAASLLQAGVTPKIETAVVAQEIDALLQKGWQQNGLAANSPATDEVFLRRIYLDVIGRIPTYRETVEFLSSESSEKRAELIDSLLDSEGYVHHFFSYWADVLRLQQYGRGGTAGGAAYIRFVKDSLRTNKPYDQFVRQLIAARGKPWENGAIGYYMRDNRMPLDNFANTARIFLGTRIECAQCHDHPFDKWTQMQFYQMTAFTYGNEVKAYVNPAITGAQELVAEQRRELARRFPKADIEATPQLAAQHAVELEQLQFLSQAVRDVQYLLMGGVGVEYHDERRLQLPHDYQYEDAKPESEVLPATMMGAAANRRPNETNTDAYARWMTSPENPRFTTVIANRLWKHAFGLALIEPLDDIKDSTVAVNPELMTRLEKLVRNSGYDMKTCLRVVFNTRAYQAATTKAEVLPGTAYQFTGPVLRRMSAEQMYDSFVTLINLTPDRPSEHFTRRVETPIVEAGKFIDAIDLVTAEEVLHGATEAAEYYRAAADMAIQLRGEIEEAKANKDAETANKLTKQVMQARAGGRRALGRTVILPAVQRLSDKMEGTSTHTGLFATAPAYPNAQQLLGSPTIHPCDEAKQFKVKGYDKSDKTPEEQQAELDAVEQAYWAEAEYFNVPEANRKQFITARRSQMIYWNRAADNLSPAFRGSYLRIFGQSDRELIENSNRDASIPQALTLMNSKLLLSAMSPSSQLMLAINRSADPEEQLNAVYLSLLSREPSARERAAWRRAQADGLDSIDDLIYALLNTKRFIFIQ